MDIKRHKNSEKMIKNMKIRNKYFPSRERAAPRNTVHFISSCDLTYLAILFLPSTRPRTGAISEGTTGTIDMSKSRMHRRRNAGASRATEQVGRSVEAPERSQVVEYAYDLRRVVAPWLMSDMSDILLRAGA